VRPEDIEGFQGALLEWFERNGRDMPFRRTRDPYAVWISEIMLQQTTVAAVLPFWERFMERFPTVEALAAAPLDDVLHAWAGLGYYTRARNLHRAALEIMANHDGRFPSRFEDLLALPGVGRYTAGAVSSLAGGEDRPVVDANVARVLARVETIEGDPRSGPAHRALWDAAETLLPRGRARDWNLALFDLGAMVCVPVDPKCLVCPVSSWCGAYRTGRQRELPHLAARAPLSRQTDVAAVIRDAGGRLLLVRRPEGGVWAGLWELPRGTLEPGEDPAEGLKRIVRELLGVEIEVGEEAVSVRHTVMRRGITLRAFHARAASGNLASEPGASARWTAPGEWRALAVSSPQRRILEHIDGTAGTADTPET